MDTLIPQALLEHAAFAPYRGQLDELRAHLEDMRPQPLPLVQGERCQEFLAASRSNSRHAPGEVKGSTNPVALIPRFVPPPARAVSAIEFERRIVERNELIVRPDNLHDVMNALIWLTFPKTKRTISEAHVTLGVTANGKTRPRRRDVLTLFDEAGIIILSPRDDLKHLHEAHEWRKLFIDHRNDFIHDARPILFGHGALEQLASNPHRGLTVKTLWLPAHPDMSIAEVDDWFARQILRNELLTADEHRLPLPLLGLPGWYAENEAADCYDDVTVFRPLRIQRSQLYVCSENSGRTTS